MDEESALTPDFKDIETKLGRKVPDSLRSLLGGKHQEKPEEKPATVKSKTRANSADLKRLDSKMLFLKQEMANLRAIDVKLMQQLMYINEGIESIRWVMEEKGGVTSRESSLNGSLYSLSDSQDGTSPRGSFASLHDGNSDGLDGISVGSYLDTLGEDMPEEDMPGEDMADDPSPTDLHSFSEKAVFEEPTFSKPPMRLRVESDEYYCFG